MKRILHPLTGKVYSFGRKRSSLVPRLKLSDYFHGRPIVGAGGLHLRGKHGQPAHHCPPPPAPTPPPAPGPAPSPTPPGALPLPPVTLNYDVNAAQAIAQMYGNDTLGDCVIAAFGHAEGVLTALETGSPTIFTGSQIVGAYSTMCGYVDGDSSTDQGCDISQCLEDWATGGFVSSAHKISGAMAVDATNVAEWQTAIYLFSNIIIGLELPDAWVSPPPSVSGFTWDVTGAPDPNNGHCIVSGDYTALGPVIDTWGMTGQLTIAAMNAYVSAAAGGECYTVLSPEIIEAGKTIAPSGFNWKQLEADLLALS